MCMKKQLLLICTLDIPFMYRLSGGVVHLRKWAGWPRGKLDDCQVLEWMDWII